MTTLGVVLLRCLVQGTLLSLAAAAIYWMCRRLGARAAARSLSTGLALVVLLSLLAISPRPSWRLADGASPEHQAPSAAQGMGERSPSSANSEAQADATGAESAAADRLRSPQYRATWSAYVAALVDAASRGSVVQQDSTAGWVQWLAGVAAAGVLLCAARLAWGLYEVRRLLAQSRPIDEAALHRRADLLRSNMNLRRCVELRQSDQTATPATIGWRRPTVLLPAQWRQWSDAELQAVLAHELAHVAGRDFAAWVVAQFAVVVHFYNPLVRWLARRLQLEQELAADAVAAASMNDSHQYLKSLASLALSTPAHRMSGPARTLFPSRSLLLRRVEMLRSPMLTVKNRILATRLQWVAGCLLAAIAVGVAGLRQPPQTLAQAAENKDDQPRTYVEITPTPPIPLKLIPSDSVYAFSIKPAAIAAQPQYSEVVKLLDEDSNALYGLNVRLEEIVEIVIAVPLENEPRFILRMATPDACNRILENATAQMKLQQTANQGHYTTAQLELQQTLNQGHYRSPALSATTGSMAAKTTIPSSLPKATVTTSSLTSRPAMRSWSTWPAIPSRLNRHWWMIRPVSF